MIKPWMAKVIGIMPDFILVPVAKKLVDKYLFKYADITVEGLDNLKGVNEPIIFIGNHLSNSDGLVLNEVLKEFDPYFVAGIKLSKDVVTNLGTKVVKTINIKPNSADTDSIKKIVSTVKKGNNLFIFPEGTRSRTGEMIEAKKGILLIARMTKAKIVPLGITGTEKLLPINKEGDMASEMFNYAKVNVKFGEPLVLPRKLKDEDKHSYDDRLLNYYMKGIASLLPDNYRGVYK